MLEDLVSYREILDNLAEGVYFTDSDRQILYWNAGAEHITGHLSSDVVGSHCWDNILMHVDGLGNSLCKGMCPLMRAMRQGSVIETEAFLSHKKGHRIPVLIRTIPIRDAQGKVVGAVEMFRDNSAQLALRNQVSNLEQLAMADALTQIGNRRFLEFEIRKHLDEFVRYGWGVGLLFMDIDGLKIANDKYGHDAGDEVLGMVARTVSGACRSSDMPGRWGGDEFMVVCGHSDEHGLRALAERIRMLIEASHVLQGDDRIRVTVSIGATLARPDDDLARIVERADRLMYRSKQQGKNCVSFG